MPDCPYCSRSTFVKNLHNELVCAACSAPAPEGAFEQVPVDPRASVVVLKTPLRLSSLAIDRLRKDVAEIFPGRRVIILEEGSDIQFIGGPNAS
jgi:hypothetical protein